MIVNYDFPIIMLIAQFNSISKYKIYQLMIEVTFGKIILKGNK